MFQVLLAEITKDQGHISRITQYCDSMVRGQKRTPKGLVYISDWGSLRMAANAVYLCLEVSNNPV